ncbi:hypothetical protein [Aquisphaera insulae]|uniref:hypothetical protein n=1 Tax=Aquisphaera insulae TaxID=2712864 RepID=UPI0013ED0818|nr:hypothetical protein [Aquisphaera insulae]
MGEKLAKLIDRKRKQSADGPRINWDDRRDAYVTAVDHLYALIENILAAPLRDGAVQVQRRPKNLEEAYIGSYRIEDLVLFFGDEQVRFSPQGRNILGAEGRVDVLGERGTATLILNGGTWSRLLTRQPRVTTEQIDEEVVVDMLNAIMRD